MANLRELVDILNDIARPKRPWTEHYLFNLIKGYKGFTLTDQLKGACEIHAGHLDGQSPLQVIIGNKKPVLAYGINGLAEGDIVLGKAIPCPYCGVRFVPRSVNGKYCCSEHKRLYYNEKRRMKND